MVPLGVSGLGTDYDENMDNFVCPVCEGKVSSASDVVKLQKSRIADMKRKVKEAKAKHAKAKKELNDVFADICNTMGSAERRLDEVLEKDLKIQRQAFHSQCFVGNDCKQILAEHEKLNDFVVHYNSKFF